MLDYAETLEKAPIKCIPTLCKGDLTLYTDASLESSVADLGGVLFDSSGKREEEETVCVGFWLWRATVGSNNLVVCVDNDATKAALVRGSSRGPEASVLLRWQALGEAEQGIVPWFSRVPSKANASDEPSRTGECSLCKTRHFSLSLRLSPPFNNVCFIPHARAYVQKRFQNQGEATPLLYSRARGSSEAGVMRTNKAEDIDFPLWTKRRASACCCECLL